MMIKRRFDSFFQLLLNTDSTEVSALKGATGLERKKIKE